ncbi:MAG: EAL domain-containing protein [Cyanobacteria bacterium J06638_20]
MIQPAFAIKPPTILVVDDEPDNFDVIETFLNAQDYDLHYANTGEGAIAVLDELQPDLILLDVMMPGMDGIEVCRRLKAAPRWAPIPVIIVTSLTEKRDLARCFEAGADDFISKPLSSLELGARVRSMLRIREQYKQLQSFSVRLETTVQKRTAQLQKMVFQDALTQLPSRACLTQALAEQLQSGDSSFALMSVDCDQFKRLLGSFGDAITNQLLVAIAERLKTHLREGDVLARIGEDEFCILLHPVEGKVSIQPLIQKILSSFDAPFTLSSFEIFVSACAGIALGKESYTTPTQLFQDAGTAMYHAKQSGIERYHFFDAQLHQAMVDRLALENDLKRALERQEFIAYYQPIMNLKKQAIAGVEALMHWHHPERGMVYPSSFITCMETTGLIVPMGMVIFQQACQQLHRWHQKGWTNLTMSVNLSVQQFACPTLVDDIDRILNETGVDPAFVKLEITESAIMNNITTVKAIAEQLRSRRIQISIDDFGTGYSSLAYLHQLPIDNLKIDRSFITQIPSQHLQSKVVDTIVTLGKHLGLTVTAEGIETASELEYLQQLDCEFGQGYLFARPITADDVEAKFLRHTPAIAPTSKCGNVVLR